jgi:cytochrome c5
MRGSSRVLRGAVGVALAIAAASCSSANEGERVYELSCAACHAVGSYGAPRTGRPEDWAPRLARGERSLYEAALKGKTTGDRFMPPRGGNPRLTDAEVKGAVDYIVARSR